MSEKFADLGSARRLWVVSAIHGDLERLTALHDHIASRFAVRDRLVYLGNYIGTDARRATETLDEILMFRSALMSKQGVEPTDITYLRGPAEEAWQRLLRLQFAPSPLQTLEKLFASGVEGYVRMYGISLSDTKSMARSGTMAITRWTNQLRNVQRSRPGHDAFMSATKRAAYGALQPDGKRILLVPAGYDSLRNLEDQADSLWWTTAPFQVAGRAQGLYNRIVRGFDSVNAGAVLDDAAITLDAGAGRGGPLLCGCFVPTGHLTDLVAVGAQGSIETIQMERRAANDSAHNSMMYAGQAPANARPQPSAPLPIVARDQGEMNNRVVMRA